jgi:hypothetical protein
MNKYAMCPFMYEGEMFPEVRFVFEANTDNDADIEGIKWANYHGWSRRDVLVRRIQGEREANMPVHNEYLIK